MGWEPECRMTDLAGPTALRPGRTWRAARSWRLDRVIWVAVALALVLDVGTTAVGLRAGYVEANPVGGFAVAGAGVAGLVIVKLVAVAVGVALWRWLPARHRSVVPLALAGPWCIAAVGNVLLLA